ncbi:hypothetical protein CCHL11_06493 [Colletotrichum chlorophyti]|uniref:Complex 1 LYR protein domain-containing protein n=1 Tax=Colletotrichum chlorophyti TaxID=708187 RepID=A0A1Q8RRZ3_9PEZI|nr:hypothetical protein CCHL11_06493 [Colletotrichum chlorophyti]
MPPSQFIPARNSRHRVACIALYRALVREARAVPLPDDVLRRSQNPIPRLVKKGFRRNRTETSYRIVFAALATGYKFLNLFKSAQTQGSKEHSEIISYLGAKNLRDERSQRRQPAPSPPPTPPPPKPQWLPLLVNTAQPSEIPVFVSPRHPVPREQLSGRRSVPNVAVTTEGIAFLRQGKPQPHRVTRYVMRKTKIKRDLMDTLLATAREDVPFAAEEDRWEALVKEMTQKQNPAADGGEKGERGYATGANATYKYASRRLEDERRIQLARARAFLEIHKVEKAAVEKEKQESGEESPESERLRLKMRRRANARERSKRRSQRREKRIKEAWKKRLVGLEPAAIRV